MKNQSYCSRANLVDSFLCLPSLGLRLLSNMFDRILPTWQIVFELYRSKVAQWRLYLENKMHPGICYCPITHLYEVVFPQALIKADVSTQLCSSKRDNPGTKLWGATLIQSKHIWSGWVGPLTKCQANKVSEKEPKSSILNRVIFLTLRFFISLPSTFPRCHTKDKVAGCSHSVSRGCTGMLCTDLDWLWFCVLRGGDLCRPGGGSSLYLSVNTDSQISVMLDTVDTL